MVIRDVNPSITTLSVPFLRFGHIKVGGRATIVKLTSGALAVFSPVALTPTVRSKVSSLGDRVSYITAPDLEHHIFLSDWASVYPNAQIIAPDGLAAKRASSKDAKVTNVPITHVFTAKDKASVSISPEFDADFNYEFVDVHPNKELVFFHKPTKTLIEADLLFNLPATEQYSRSGIDATSGWATRIFGSLQNTKGAAIWQKRLIWYAFSAKDREGFNRSIRKIDSWGIENIVPCHGDVIVGNGNQIFKKVFEWHLESKAK